MQVDIYNGATAVGSGPITTAKGWRQVTRLDRIGEFSFSCPASDPQAAQLVAGRHVYCIDAGKTVGAGIIRKIETGTADGVPTLTISGPDLTQELAEAHIESLALNEAGWSRCVNVFELKIDPILGGALAGPNDVTNAYDSDPATYATGSWSGTDWWWLYVGAAEPFQTIQFVRGVGGGVSGPTTNLQYFNGSAWINAATISDYTDIGGNSFQQDGTIDFTLAPGDSMAQTTEQGRAAHFVRMKIGLTCNNARIYDIHTWGHIPTATALALIEAQFPTVANGYVGTWTHPGLVATVKTDVYESLYRVSVFEALTKLAELTGEHFYCTYNREVYWIGNTTASSGVRVMSPPSPALVQADTTIALLSSLRITSDSHDTCTRVYPRGAGLGDGSLGLTYATRSAPAGYVVNKSAGYIRIDPEGTRRDGKADLKDVGAATADLRARENAANALFDAALVWLGRHSAANVSYAVSVTNLARGMVRPGNTVYVDYQQYVANQQVLSVATNLIVLEITDTIGQSVAITSDLTVSTLAAWPITDTEFLARMYRNQRAMGSTPQAVGLADIRTADFGVDSRPLGTGGGGLARSTSSVASGGGGGGGAMAIHEMVSGWHSVTVSGAGKYVRSDSATTAVWASIADADLPATIVRTSRGLTAGAGLTGGGDLSADRTLAVGAGLGITVNADDVALATSVAGAGLTYTTGVLAVGAGLGLTVNADDVALTTPGTLSVSSGNASAGSHTHAVTSSANPGAAASILASDASGHLRLAGLGIGAAPSANNVTLADAGLLQWSDVGLSRVAANTVGIATGKGLQSNYTSGWAGSGWRLDDASTVTGKSFLEVDNLSVRGVMSVYELLIHKIRATNGSIFVANTGKVKTVSYGGGNYTIVTEGDHGFADGDLIRAQRFTTAGGGGAIYQSDIEVGGVTSATEFWGVLRGGSTAPAVGMEFVRLGNIHSTAGRMGSIYLTADDTNAPYINILDGVAAWADWGTTSKTKARIGQMNGAYGVTSDLYGIGLGDYAGGNYLKYDSNGGLIMKSANGVLTIDQSGLRLSAPTAESQGASLSWLDGATVISSVWAQRTLTQENVVSLTAKSLAATKSYVQIQALAPTGYNTNATVTATSGTTTVSFVVRADDAHAWGASLTGGGLSLDPSYANSVEGTLRLPSAGYIGLGSAAGRMAFNSTPTPDALEVRDANLWHYGGGGGGLILNDYSTGTDSERIYFWKYRGTEGTRTVVANNDNIGRFHFFGYDGAALQSAAYIEVQVDGAPGSSVMPGRIVMSVSPSNGATPAEALRISSTKAVSLAGAFGCNGATARTPYVVGAAAVDQLTEVITLANNLRTMAINNGMAVAA